MLRRATSARLAWMMAAIASLAVGVAACSGSVDASLRDRMVAAGVVAIQAPQSDPALYELGEALFFDPILSGNLDVSCATCHEPALRTIDDQSIAIGTGGLGRGAERALAEAFLHVPRNSPDLFNRGHDSWHTFFWDGRVSVADGTVVSPAGDAMPVGVDSVQVAQAMITIASPIEMRGFPGDLDVNGDVNELALIPPDDWAAIWEATFARLVTIEGYRRLLEAAYPGLAVTDLDLSHAVRALAHYQAVAFATPDTDLDRFLRGDDAALSARALAGAELFFGSARCSDCHSGPLLTDQAFYSIAAPQVGPGRGDVAPLDAGLGAVDGSGEIAFRTPPLRNVAETAPYFHDGAYWSLADAVAHHADPLTALGAYDPAQLRADVATDHLGDVEQAIAESLTLEPTTLSEEDLGLLVAFLEALTSDGLADLGALVPAAVPSGLDLYR